MTGMDVMRRCRAYESDMARLRLRLRVAQDAATRTTRSPETAGRGGSGDRMGDYAARADAIYREMREREAQYRQDIDLAARLIAKLEPDQGTVIYLRMVRGMTMRQIAAELHTSESSAKGFFRRGCAALSAMREL